MSLSLSHAAADWQRNATMYRRTWKSNLLPNFFEPVFYLSAIGIGVGSYITEMGGVSYIEFLAPGLVCVAAMNNGKHAATEVPAAYTIDGCWELVETAEATAPFS